MDFAAARPQMEAYAKDHGLFFYENWSLPQQTQILQHGFMQEVPNLIMGDLPGDLEDGWLAHFNYKTIGRDIEDHPFTIAIAKAEPSAKFAVRVICHDRDLSELDNEDPGEGLQVLERDDRAVKLESGALLERYAIWVGGDQDQIRAWQLFSPALIDWLTREAPADFSFELQNGALSCFVPGVVADAPALDALCDAAARIHSRLLEIAPAVDGPGGRDDEIDRKLAEHPFEKPPKSVMAAALHFGPVPLISGSSWELGSEAFFRTHMTALGLDLVDPPEFVAGHIDTVVTGTVTQAAQGTLPGTKLRGWFLWSTDADDRALGWQTVLAEIDPMDNGYAYTQLDIADAAEKDGFHIVSDAGSISIFKPTIEPRRRNAEQLDEFLETACPLLEQCVAAAKRR